MYLNKKFLYALKKGTGEAYKILKKHPNIDFSDEIIAGAVKNLAYDAQCEGSRGEYIFGLIQLSQQKEKIRAEIFAAFEAVANENWDVHQLYNILSLYNDAQARAAIYKRFEKDAANGFEDGETTILKLDKLAGLQRIIAARERLCAEKDENFYDNITYLMDRFQDDKPTIDFRGVVSDIYLEKYEEMKAKQATRPSSYGFDYEKVVEKIKNNEFIHFRRHNLTDIDIKKLADDFLKETDKKKWVNYLSLFSHVQFPYHYEFIFNMIKDKNAKKDNLLTNGIDALAFFQSPAIREYALEKLSERVVSEDYMVLLMNNYEESDSKMLSEAAQKTRSQDKLHELMGSFMKIYRNNYTKSCKMPLEILYQKTTCALCRCEILEILHKNEVLSDEILSEMQYDCNANIRELYAEITKI
jgi:hypothetical protein